MLNRVALYLFEDGSYVIENFNDERVALKLDGKSHEMLRLDLSLEMSC